MFINRARAFARNAAYLLSRAWWAGLGVLIAVIAFLYSMKDQNAAPASVDPPEVEVMCADFRNMPDEYQMSNGSLVENGILFQELGVEPNERFGLRTGYGLVSFPRDGMEITFPEATDFIEISVETYAGPVQLSVFDRQENELHSEEFLRRNASRSTRYAFNDMFKLRLVGGSSEAGVSIVCFSAES